MKWNTQIVQRTIIQAKVIGNLLKSQYIRHYRFVFLQRFRHTPQTSMFRAQSYPFLAPQPHILGTRKAPPRRERPFADINDAAQATPGVKDGGSLAGKDSFEASSTTSSSQASE